MSFRLQGQVIDELLIMLQLAGCIFGVAIWLLDPHSTNVLISVSSVARVAVASCPVGYEASQEASLPSSEGPTLNTVRSWKVHPKLGCLGMRYEGYEALSLLPNGQWALK